MKPQLDAVRRLDLGDLLIIVGLMAIIGGVAAFSLPAGCIVFGVVALLLGVGVARSTPKAN